MRHHTNLQKICKQLKVQNEYLSVFKFYQNRVPEWQEITAHPNVKDASTLRSSLKDLQDCIAIAMSVLRNKSSISKQNIVELNNLEKRCKKFNEDILSAQKELLTSFFLYYKEELERWAAIAEDYFYYSKNKKPYDLVQKVLISDVNNALAALKSSAPLSDDILLYLKELAKSYPENRADFSKLAKEAMGKLKAKRAVAPAGPLTYKKNPPVHLAYDPNRVKFFIWEGRAVVAANDASFKEESKVNSPRKI